MKILSQSIHLELMQANDTGIVCVARYGVSSDGLREDRQLEVELTNQQKQTIRNFATTVVLPAIKAAEKVV